MNQLKKLTIYSIILNTCYKKQIELEECLYQFTLIHVQTLCCQITLIQYFHSYKQKQETNYNIPNYNKLQTTTILSFGIHVL